MIVSLQEMCQRLRLLYLTVPTNNTGSCGMIAILDRRSSKPAITHVKKTVRRFAHTSNYKRLRPGLYVEFHMHRIKYQFESLRMKTAAFDLDVAFHMCPIEFASTENIVMERLKFSFFLLMESL